MILKQISKGDNHYLKKQRVSRPHGHASFCKQNPFLSKLSNSEYQIDIAFKS
jgi:hypothetical protein